MKDKGDTSDRADDHATSMTLLHLAQQNDSQAWRQLVADYGPRILRQAVAGGLRGDDANDVLQEVLKSVFEKLDTFRRDKPEHRFRKWLSVITKNKIRDHYRKVRNRPQAQGGTTALDWLHQQEARSEAADRWEDGSGSSRSSLQSEDPAVNEVLERVRSAVTAKTWAAFWKTAVERLPASVVAEELNMTVAAVWKARGRVRARLDQELSRLQLPDDDSPTP